MPNLTIHLLREGVDCFAEQMLDWPRDAGRSALFKDASPQQILARAKRARAEPIAPESWRRSLAAVRVFMTGLIAQAELDPAFIQAFDRWIGARTLAMAPMAPVERILDASYSYTWRADGSLDVHADTEADHRRVMELHDRVNRSAPRGPSAKAVRSLGDARDLFLTQFKEKNPAAATVHETVATLGLFVDIVGAGKPMDEVGVDDVDAFRAVLAVWPTRARVLPAYKGLSTRDIIKKAKKEQPPGINVRTKDKHLDNVRKFFGWAVQRHEMTHNTLSGVRLQTKAQKTTLTRRGFTQPELAALFARELRAAHAATPSYFWLPLLPMCSRIGLGMSAWVPSIRFRRGPSKADCRCVGAGNPSLPPRFSIGNDFPATAGGCRVAPLPLSPPRRAIVSSSGPS